MLKTKIFFFLFLFAILSLSIGVFMEDITAADFVVNSTTNDNDIDDWMKSSSTIKGDSLVFNVTGYDLNDTITISKPINVKSNVNTQITFNKDKNMFNITASEISFFGLTLEHNGKGSFDVRCSLIFGTDSAKILNINNVNFILNNDYLNAVSFNEWNGDISNSNVIGKGSYNLGFLSDNWIGNVYASSFDMKKEISAGIGVFTNWVGSIFNCKFDFQDSESFAVFVYKQWTGNFLDSNVSSLGISSYGILAMNWLGNISNSQMSLNNNHSCGIASDYWIGNMQNTNISTKGLLTYGVWAEKWTGIVSSSNIYIEGYRSFGFYSNSSTYGLIINSVISAKNGIGIMISKNIKVQSTKAVSIRGQDNIYVFGPILQIMAAYKKSKTSRNYYIKVHNYGEEASKTSYLTIKIGKYKKTVKFKAVKPGKYRIVKIVLGKKYSSKKHWKSAKVTYYKGNGKKTVTKALKFKF